jgi:hypothetical protein
MMVFAQTIAPFTEPFRAALRTALSHRNVGLAEFFHGLLGIFPFCFIPFVLSKFPHENRH